MSRNCHVLFLSKKNFDQRLLRKVEEALSNFFDLLGFCDARLAPNGKVFAVVTEQIVIAATDARTSARDSFFRGKNFRLFAASQIVNFFQATKN